MTLMTISGLFHKELDSAKMLYIYNTFINIHMHIYVHIYIYV